MPAKRLIDLLFAVPGAIALAPVMGAIALWIKLEGDGPVLFAQTRVGKGGREFKLYKFRTMVPLAPGETDAGVTMRGHPRVKRASGRFLRKTKLDELPQLFNVIRGDMSLVGPRPELPEYVRCYSDEDRAVVLSVLPGITDPASLQFVDEEELLTSIGSPRDFYVNSILPRKVRLYRDYIHHQSLLFDLKLLLLTVGVVISPWLRRRLQAQAATDIGSFGESR